MTTAVCVVRGEWDGASRSGRRRRVAFLTRRSSSSLAVFILPPFHASSETSLRQIYNLESLTHRDSLISDAAAEISRYIDASSVGMSRRTRRARTGREDEGVVRARRYTFAYAVPSYYSGGPFFLTLRSGARHELIHSRARPDLKHPPRLSALRKRRLARRRRRTKRARRRSKPFVVSAARVSIP